MLNGKKNGLVCGTVQAQIVAGHHTIGGIPADFEQISV